MNTTKHMNAVTHRLWTAMPNFVDCDVFRPPASPDEKTALRRSAGVPADALVVISVAALKKGHKRVDHVIREFRAAERVDSFLVLAGASTSETPDIRALAGADPRIRILTDYPHGQIADLLRMADVMVLGSLFEMMPIAVLEGLASGLPVITHCHPVMMWMTGAEGARPQTPDHRLQTQEMSSGNVVCPTCGGLGIDMGRDGVLADALAGLTPAWIEEHGRNARQRALKMFSSQAVIRQYAEYYRNVLRANP